MEGLPGSAFYDDDQVFARYMATRKSWLDNPNDTLERPTMLELIGSIADVRVLDLGCGDASFGRHALEQGCRSYLGIDDSNNMIEAAQDSLADGPGQVTHASIESWTYPREAFDLVVSSLAFHYVSDLNSVLEGAFRALVPDGRFVFSVEHPLITACDRGWGDEVRSDWLVDDYFLEGPRVTSWLGGRVVKVHRTVETYVSAMQAAGFVLDRLRESRPRRERFSNESEYERRIRFPLFLFLAGHKLSPS
jgi:SAM-dependent methyltransferase